MLKKTELIRKVIDNDDIPIQLVKHIRNQNLTLIDFHIFKKPNGVVRHVTEQPIVYKLTLHRCIQLKRTSERFQHFSHMACSSDLVFDRRSIRENLFHFASSHLKG